MCISADPLRSQRRVRPGFSMERKERKFEFKHYEVLDKMSCVDGLEDLRTDKPQSIETLLKNMARELFLESGPNI